MHLQFGHSSPHTSPDPDSKWDGAVGVVLVMWWWPPQPALRNESFSIWKLILIVTHCIVTQMELCLKKTIVMAYVKGPLSAFEVYYKLSFYMALPVLGTSNHLQQPHFPQWSVHYQTRQDTICQINFSNLKHNRYSMSYVSLLAHVASHSGWISALTVLGREVGAPLSPSILKHTSVLSSGSYFS